MLKNRIALFVVALALPICSQAQDRKITATDADDIAAQQVTSLKIIVSSALTKAGRSAHDADLIATANRSGDQESRENDPTLFPADLSKFRPTAQTLQTTTLHNIYINRAPSAWGNPVRFLNDLNHSEFIHITDQYVGVDFDDRYPLGASFSASLAPVAAFPPTPANPTPPINIFSVAQVVSVLHNQASIAGTGHDHVYNVFIPPGDDICFFRNGQPTSCFSPDNVDTFAFCAFHGAVVFKDIGEVLFTVEPETGVPGCASQQPSPNGIVADSVDDTLSHEVFETITDPDGDAFRALGSNALFGEEIGDVCQPAGNNKAQFLVPTFNVNGHPYAIQLEYSNRGHVCLSEPLNK